MAGNSTVSSDSEGCAKEMGNGANANQLGSWPFGRAGWCAGQDVKPWIFDITDWIDWTNGQNSMRYQGLYNGQNYVPQNEQSGANQNIHANIWIVYYTNISVQSDTTNVLYIGHSFGRPFADQMEHFSSLAGINHNQTIEFSGGASGAPDQLWADDGHRENIKAILDTGTIDVLIMICCSADWVANLRSRVMIRRFGISHHMHYSRIRILESALQCLGLISRKIMWTQRSIEMPQIKLIHCGKVWLRA